MFDNGSFLRRRRRFKKKELPANGTTKLTDALKTLDRFGANSSNQTPANMDCNHIQVRLALSRASELSGCSGRENRNQESLGGPRASPSASLGLV